jgi:hypothetical protein
LRTDGAGLKWDALSNSVVAFAGGTLTLVARVCREDSTDS